MGAADSDPPFNTIRGSESATQKLIFVYLMNEWELKVVKESISDYERGEVINNEDVFNKNEK